MTQVQLGLGGWRPRGSVWLVSVPESKVAAPADMIAIGDAFTETAGDVIQADVIFGMNFAQGGKPPSEFSRTASKRHQGKLNVAFCDGHVEAPRVKALFDRQNPEFLRRWNVGNQPHKEMLR